MNVLCTLSATRLARLIRSREVSSREVVEAHIARAAEVNPTINAIVRDRFDDARREADLADARLRESAEGLPPFHGVPCTIKENLGLQGMPHSSGLVARKDVTAPEDGTAVARLRAAGAIPIGVTNLSELCMWMETSNRIYGRTNNPYDARHIVGGSSGGEGAMVAAGGSPVGLGADIGGSIRMPAFFCGVFGHKPSGGLVPSTGHYPVTENELQRYNCVGPLARRAEDLMPILRLIAGPDGREELCRADLILGDPATVALEGLRVVVVEENGVTPVADELRLAQRRAAEALRARGAVVETAGVEALRHSFEVWSAMLDAARGKPFSELLGNGKPFQAGRELLRWTVRRSPHTLPAIALAALEKLPALLPARARRALEIGRALKEELTSLVGTGVLLYPPYAEVAPRHYKPMWPPFNWVYTAILNVMEFAVTQVPLGLNDRGLPVGVQVAAPPGADHRTIAVALTLEQTFGGWVPPERM